MNLRDRLTTPTSRGGRQALAAWIAALLTVSGIAVVAERDESMADVRTDRGASRPDPVRVSPIPELTLPTISLPEISVPAISVPELPIGDVTIPSIELPPVTVPPIVEEIIGDIVGPDGAPVDIDREGFWLVDADRNHARIVLSDVYPMGVSFAPDGRSAVVAAYDATPHGSLPVTLWIVDLVTGLRHALVEPLAGLGAPSWSPDGSWIAYTHPWGGGDDPSAPEGPHGVGEIWLVRPDGSDAHLLAVTDGFGGKLAWSPDGGRLVANLYNDNRVLVADVRNGTEARWPFTEPYISDWSPDGSQLVVSSDFGGATAIMDPATGATRTISADGGFARWSPSGEWIAVSDVNDAVALLRPDGSAGPSFSYGIPVDWSSDGRSLDYQNHTAEVRVADVASRTERVAAVATPDTLSVSPTVWVPGTRWIGVLASNRAAHYAP